MTNPRIALGEITEINPKGPSKGELAPDDPVDFVPMAFVSETGTMRSDGQRPYSEVSKGYTAFKNNDVLLAKITPCFENNKIAQAHVTTSYAFGSTEFHVIRTDAAKLDKGYLCHFLRQDYIRDAGERRMTGSGGQRRVPKAFLEELKIPLPPLEEQKRIAGILDQADALRRLRTRALDKLNTLGQAIFHEMFGEIGTSALPTQNFGNFAEIKLGKMLDRGKFKGGETKPYLRNVNVRWFNIDTSDVLEMEFAEKELERFSVRKGDLLICEGGEPGRCAIWTDGNTEIYYQKALHRVRLDEKVALPDYIAFWFFVAAKTGKFSDFISAATIAHLTGAKIKQLPIMLPDISEQRLFENRLKEIEHCRAVFENQLGKQQSLFASLQHRAFRGEL